MNSVAGVSGTKEAKDLAKVNFIYLKKLSLWWIHDIYFHNSVQLVKNDLIEIGVAAGQKKSDACVKAADKTAKDLEKFVLAAFK